MVGIKRLQRIQLGKETTPGTAVVATTRWRGMGATLDDQRVVEEIEEMMGIIEGADRTVITQLLGGIELAETPATTEQLQYLLAMGLGGPVTGSADGAGTDKVYTTTVPTTAKPTLVTYTIEGGDDFEVQRLEYAVAKKITIKGTMGQTARMSATLLGRQVQRFASGFTAATIPAVSELPVQQGKLYLDAIGGTYGTTQVTNVIIAFQIDIEPVIQPVFTMDGNLYFAYPSYIGHKITGTLTFLHDTAAGGASGALSDFRAQTPKKLQIKLLGDAVTTGGTTYQNKQILINLPMKYLSPGPMTDNNGNDIYTFKLRSRYNTTSGEAGQVIVVNELASLP